MIAIIRNIRVYKSKPVGIKDVMLMGDKIAAIEDEIDINLNGIVEVKEMYGTGKILVPGFIDCHVYILDGGGKVVLPLELLRSLCQDLLLQGLQP